MGENYSSSEEKHAVGRSSLIKFLVSQPTFSTWSSRDEALHFLIQVTHTELEDNSVEQELVDCDTSYDEGCNGGLLDYAFQFIIKNRGIDTEVDYPYTGMDGRCDTYGRNAKVVSIDSYEDIPANNENALKKAVANQPVSVAIEAGGRAFQLYESVIDSLLNNTFLSETGNGNDALYK
ncbi:hypothetical protein DH2020_037965 [Rehmannia glutinosa]|uniref:Peptidase C1A papain C-terminal domain-containing protein n=1 Tax=Rehmannia glutinosa TaxID=99300 RepID=A0ABR0V161_REHGL